MIPTSLLPVPDDLDTLRLALVAAISAARSARRGDPHPIEPVVRDYARARREAGSPVTSVLVEIKALLVEHAGTDAAPFTPKVVGWTVAGYFAGS
jgi:hypothetical protein